MELDVSAFACLAALTLVNGKSAKYLQRHNQKNILILPPLPPRSF